MKRMGIILIVVGVVIAIVGVVMVVSQKGVDAGPSGESEQYSSATDTDHKSVKADSATLTDPKEIGNAFEDFVANMFADKTTYKVLEWNQGTTSSNGVYGENEKNPDFRVRQSCNRSDLEYWVECKYRSLTDDGIITIKRTQLKRYRGIQGSSRIKIFVTIGVGGDPRNPDALYVVPLDSIDDENVRLEDISRFKVDKNGEAFAGYIADYFFNYVFKKIPK